MKIKVNSMAYEQVMTLPKGKSKKPKRPNLFFRTLVRMISIKDLKDSAFTYTEHGIEKLKDKPCLIMMNHSSFLDLEIVSKIFYPRPYGIVCTSDGFIGKEWLMYQLGCIPTAKFTTDLGLLNNMSYMLHDKKTSVLMYPEASYSFDGCATPLPKRMGLLIKKLKVPVIMVRTYGAFAYDPLYNGLKKRKVKVNANVYPLISEDDLYTLTAEEMDKKLNEAFSFDHFAWQKKENMMISETFRADGLDRILYRCPACGQEKHMEGKGTTLICKACGKAWEMTPLGEMKAKDGYTEFAHIPDWFAWERSLIHKQLKDGNYSMKLPVKIGMMVNYQSIYMVGEGILTHDKSGFTLTGCEGKLHYTQGALCSYSLYADFYWYEIGDVICIGTRDCLYYCFPTDKTPVAKARLAAEESYKITKSSRKV